MKDLNWASRVSPTTVKETIRNEIARKMSVSLMALRAIGAEMYEATLVLIQRLVGPMCTAESRKPGDTISANETVHTAFDSKGDCKT